MWYSPKICSVSSAKIFLCCLVSLVTLLEWLSGSSSYCFFVCLFFFFVFSKQTPDFCLSIWTSQRLFVWYLFTTTIFSNHHCHLHPYPISLCVTDRKWEWVSVPMLSLGLNLSVIFVTFKSIEILLCFCYCALCMWVLLLLCRCRVSS